MLEGENSPSKETITEELGTHEQITTLERAIQSKTEEYSTLLEGYNSYVEAYNTMTISISTLQEEATRTKEEIEKLKQEVAAKENMLDSIETDTSSKVLRMEEESNILRQQVETMNNEFELKTSECVDLQNIIEEK